MLKDKEPRLLGKDKMVEADETYVGGKESNRHYKKKRSLTEEGLNREGKPYKQKKVIVGIIERDGKVVLKYIPSADQRNMNTFVRTHLAEKSTLYTDEYRVYSELKHNYTHKTVKHALKVYVDGDVHTNTIENFWSLLKRGIYGIYHQISDKHVSRYLDEFSARFNTRSLTSQEKFEKFLVDSESYLSYNRLIQKSA